MSHKAINSPRPDWVVTLCSFRVHHVVADNACIVERENAEQDMQRIVMEALNANGYSFDRVYGDDITIKTWPSTEPPEATRRFDEEERLRGRSVEGVRLLTREEWETVGEQIDRTHKANQEKLISNIEQQLIADAAQASDEIAEDDLEAYATKHNIPKPPQLLTDIGEWAKSKHPSLTYHLNPLTHILTIEEIGCETYIQLKINKEGEVFDFLGEEILGKTLIEVQKELNAGYWGLIQGAE